MRIGIVTMQKNEEQCLEPWVRYHGYMVGFENLTILDHNSDSPYVCHLLAEYERHGVRVKYLGSDVDYRDKGRLVAEEIQYLERIMTLDFVFPVDCDEFLFMKCPGKEATCSRSEVFAYLDQIRGFNGRLQINQNYLYILGHLGYFWPLPYQKVFFSGGNCLSLDHGSHVGVARGGDEVRVTSLAYAHFHHKPYHIHQELSRAKLRPWVDVEDTEALRAFAGPGFHLVADLLKSEEEYLSQFRIDSRAVYFKEIVDLFSLLGIDPNFAAAGPTTRSDIG